MDKALQELAQAKEALDHAHAYESSVSSAAHTKSTTKEGLGADPLSARACGQWLYDDSDNKYSLWQLKLKYANEKHSAALSEIESAKQQLTDLKQELLMASSSENDAMLKETEEELMAIEGSVKGAETLNTELAGVNNWLSLLKHACFDVGIKVKTGAAKSAALKGEVYNGSQSFELGNELELKLLSMMNGSIRVREELKCAKDDECRAVVITLEVLSIVDAMRMEPKRERSINKAFSLLAILEALKTQAENLQKDIVDLKEREEKSEAELGTLRSELENVKAELEVSRSEAKELSLALTQVEAEVARGNTLIGSLREEVSMTRSRTATVEAKSIVSVSQLSQALKQSEADLTEARTEIATLLEDAAQIAASRESLTQISQSLKQAEAQMETMKVEKQALQEELSRVHILNAAEDAKARECIEQLSLALKQVEAELEVANAEKRASPRGLGLCQESIEEAITTDVQGDFGF
ncbi:hypothetical protein GOP47_0027998, partial [Adiantum capillus-veneris]